MTDRPDRLSPLDVSNLRVEDHGLPMHVAALAILDGAALAGASGQLRLSALCTVLEQRLHLAPRLRQVLVRPPFGLGPPIWADDAGFDVRRHVRTRAVPAPGGETELLDACAELNEQPLDRARPLWEMWLLTGLGDGNVGMLIRLHHVVADGVAAVMMMGALPDPAPGAPAPVPPPWTPLILYVSGNVVTARLVAQQTDGTFKTYQGTYAVRDGIIAASDVRQIG